MLGTTWEQTRRIVRLTQVMVTPVSSNQSARGASREFVRITHGGHMTVPRVLRHRVRPRELLADDITVRTIAHKGVSPWFSSQQPGAGADDDGPARSPFLHLQVTKPSFFDKYPTLNRYINGYRLNFADSRDFPEMEDDVVLSFARLEGVFGRIEHPSVAEKPRRPEETKWWKKLDIGKPWRWVVKRVHALVQKQPAVKKRS